MRASGRWERQRTAGRALGATSCNVTAFFLCRRFSLTLNLLFVFNLQRSNATAGAGRGRGGARQRTADRIVEPCNVTAFFLCRRFSLTLNLLFIFNLQCSNATAGAGRGRGGGARQRTADRSVGFKES